MKTKMATRKANSKTNGEAAATAAAPAAVGGGVEAIAAAGATANAELRDESSLDRLARMFESFMTVQRARDEKLEKESARQAQQYSVLTHQVTQLQLDVETVRERGSTPALSRSATPEPAADTTRGGRTSYQLKMPKLEEADNIDHYLMTFEKLAAACKWPKEDWAIHLIPLLTGKARSAFIAMDPGNNMDFEKLKEAILKKYEINTDTYRSQFRAMDTSQDETPQELYIRLKDLFCKWVKYDTSSKDALMETMVLEQYMRVLYPEVRTWVKERNPMTAEEAATLVENFVAAHKGSKRYRYAGLLDRQPWGKSDGVGSGRGSGAPPNYSRNTPPPPQSKVPLQGVSCFNCGREGHKSPACPLRKPKHSYLCYVSNPSPSVKTQQSRDPVVIIELNGKSTTALVDTGCAQTLVQADLVPLEFRNDNNRLTICCVHGDTSEHSTADVYVRVCGQTYLLKVGLVPKLPYPMLLGRDLPVLSDLVGKTALSCVVTRAMAKAETIDMADFPFYGEDVLGETACTREQRCAKRRQTVLDIVDQSNLQNESDVDPPSLSEADVHFSGDVAVLQHTDPTLARLFKKAEEGSCFVPTLGKEVFILQNNILCRQSEDGLQLVVPEQYRQQVLELGHTIPWAGHLAHMKTLQRISRHFYWPGMFSQVKDYCRSCPQCQLAGGKGFARAPLVPLPVVDTPFERIGVDVVGPLEKSRSGNRFILVICDYATRYPEAFPLKVVTAKQVASCLLQLFSRVGIPREVLTDQGPNFMSRILKQVYDLLGIKRIRTTPYHPQTDGLVERFNQTLLNMLRRFVDDSGKEWDQWLPYLLFAYREVPQESTGFSPFELLYGHQVRGPLDVLKETWAVGREAYRHFVAFVCFHFTTRIFSTRHSLFL
ncbi:hypothetical protein SRHO_G00038400 [Serrasalmus rhombeus]